MAVLAGGGAGDITLGSHIRLIILGFVAEISQHGHLVGVEAALSCGVSSPCKCHGEVASLPWAFWPWKAVDFALDGALG